MAHRAGLTARAAGSGRAGLEQRLLRRLRALALPPGATILVGFSGGPDSLALAAALAAIAPIAQIRPAALHMDHGLRPDSAEEQERAAELADTVGLPFHGVAVLPEALARHIGVGIEEAARRERYLALARAADELGASVIALAHHRDDQAETVLLHLLRGAGLHGAAAMAERSTLTVPWWEGASEPRRTIGLWRPFLAESRALLRTYVAALDLTPILDRTNEELTFRRNRIRHEMLPRLEQWHPGATAALGRYAVLAAAEDAYLNDLARAALASTLTDGGALSIAALHHQALPLQRRIVRQWVATQAGLAELTADRADAIIALTARAQPGRQIEIGAGWIVRHA